MNVPYRILIGAKTVVSTCLVIGVALAISIMVAGVSAAQNRDISLSHEPPVESELPSPGSPLELAVTLLNSKNSQLHLRGFVVRDGRLMDIHFRDLTSDLYDRVVYLADIAAPLAELSYQFFLVDNQEVVATSQLYTVRRSCIDNVLPVDTSHSLSSDGKKKLEQLRDRASRLQVEVQNFESALKLIEELQALTEKKGSGKSNS
ncbi:MAG: hypothetical protein J5J00_03455 [Deltaproteobacteria bacterium]|nr:hypothetical protein [Deltaproteobacteria bacterium]